jgi:hypothetical protein
MNIRAIAISAVVGTVAMFAWQSISQMVLPWHTMTRHEVSDTTAAVIPSLRRLAPANGVYFSRFGTLMAVRIAPDKSDQTSSAAIGPMLAEQVAVDLVVVVALCVLCGLLIDQSPIGVGKAMALAGAAIGVFQSLSMAVWYGFTIPWAIVEIADQTITFFLTGLVIGFLMRRFGRDTGVAIPDGQGYRTSGGRTTAAR